MTFWTHLLFMVCLVRSVFQLVILSAIKIAKREMEDKTIKLAILKAIDKLKIEKQIQPNQS